jgi:hypothetical protein
VTITLYDNRLCGAIPLRNLRWGGYPELAGWTLSVFTVSSQEDSRRPDSEIRWHPALVWKDGGRSYVTMSEKAVVLTPPEGELTRQHLDLNPVTCRFPASRTIRGLGASRSGSRNRVSA